MYLKFRSKPPDSVYMLPVLILCSLLHLVRTDTVFKETKVNTKRILTLADSPYYIENDVLVEPEGELFIQPGVTLKFGPGAGLTVRGVLTAEGLPDNKIVFTSAGETFRQENRTIRLIDGPTVQQGIIQVLVKGKWRSVCTNSRNWTTADLTVTCRQLGFTGGEWHHWHQHLNDSNVKQILFEQPNCYGHERSIENCDLSNRRMGSGVCDLHPNLGIKCHPFHNQENRAVGNHWRGLRFESAPFYKKLTAENTLYVSYSKSVLRNVEVLNAGQGKYKQKYNATSAIESWGVPPIMEYIKVENSAYNGLNITNPPDLVTISHANITGNRGYGLYVNSTRGYVVLEHSIVANNMADGVKMLVHDHRPETKIVDGVDVHDLCTYSTTYSQTYPFLMVAEQYGDRVVDQSCEKKFYTKRGYILTLHFIHLMAGVDDSSFLEVRDGPDSTSRLLKTIPVNNFTRPESIVTTGNNMFITFSAKKKVKTELFLEITAGLQKAVDLNVTDSSVTDNNGRGVWVEKMRSNLHIHHSRVYRNNHVAGVHVDRGAGNVNITHSDISFNYADGVNITYGGGCQNISWSTLSDNVGKGLALWVNETTINSPVREEFVIAYSNISLNYDIGVLVGNFCGPSIVNVSGNYFDYGRYIGLEILSCWRDTKLDGVRDGNMMLQVGHNHFRYNQRMAMKMTPIARAIGKIEHNDFLNNLDGCIYTYNVDDYKLEIQKVDILLQENRFYNNEGTFVLHLGLSHYDFLKGQRLKMTYNWVKDNIITEPWEGLNPRSGVAAPVVISSDNVQLVRNILQNPESRYELGSQLIEPNTVLDCKLNWLGDKDEETVWERVFDRDDRYNLAKIEYLPYLLSNNINTELVLEKPLFEHLFINRETKEVGGDIAGIEELRETGVYTVTRDINVLPNGRLKITPGVVLKFLPSVGMMVSGELIAEGDNQGGQPLLTLQEWERDENETEKLGVRLVGGRTEREGRLQVEIDGEWGTVCDFGWTIESAAIACQQMGFVLNTEDWKLQPNEMPEEGSLDPILMSYVRCDDTETDIRTCRKAEREDDLLRSCSHQFDVGLRCYDVSWSGLRLGMTAKRSKLYDVKVERAGLFDYRTNVFVPGIQADFSHHVFENIEVMDNDHDGIGILYSDIFYPDHVNFLKNSVVSGNKRHGVSLRQLGLRIQNSEIRDNQRAGIYHDPKLTKLEQRELSEWMSLIDKQKPGTIIRIPTTEQGTTAGNPIIIKEKESKLLITSAEDQANTQRTYYIRAERDEFVIGMQLLNPFHNRTTELLHIYDFTSIVDSPGIRVLEVSRDIASFPSVSSSYAITLSFDSGAIPLGNMMMLLTPINCADLPGNCESSSWIINPLNRNKIYDGPIPRLTVEKSRIAFNGQGFMSLHYNRYLGHDSQVYLRKANESVEIFHSEIVSNKEAMFIFTPFRELNQFNISEIRYMINNTVFSNNEGGIYQYSKDLRDSNNIFHWVLRENTFKNNRGGGFDVSLPYVLQYNENFTHTVHIDSNNFQNNKDFGISVGGHFSRVYFVNNTLLENDCSEGLLKLSGMEKETWIFANNMQLNDGIFMVELDMDSQSEIMGYVPAYFTRNIVQRNTHSHTRLGLDSYHPASYTLAVKGVQKFNITENLFKNTELDYELLAGVRTARIGNMLNAERNYWGSDQLRVIRDRLFDFDDWNSYAVTHFMPFYLENDFDSSLSSGYERFSDIDLDNLGGRLFESIRLIDRKRPYVIRRDLTVMPDVTLTIEPGVQLEFYPSVGILVLGTLNARGSSDSNIVMRPARMDSAEYRLGRRRRQATFNPRHSSDFDVRLCQANENGTICPPGANEGYVEIFNRTTMQWVPMCDHRFTERNAEVVCRELGFSDLNVYLDFGQRIEYNENSLTRIIYWPEPFQCTGKENKLSHCSIRMNGQIYNDDPYGRKYACNWESKSFAFVQCGERNLKEGEYWGGIRFSVKNFEQELYHDHLHDAVSHVTHSTLQKRESVIQYVQIIGAGILHDERSPAVQSVMRSPLVSSVNISHSAYDGINIISPPKMVNLLYNKIENNLGVGVSSAVLTGEIREAELSAFIPLKEVPIPYHTFGMIDMCDPHKEIIIEEKILLYYKYDNNPVDCVKIFASVYDVKPIGFRLLQYNFVNSSGEPWQPDHLTLYDGDIYNMTTKPMVTIKVDGQEKERKLWQTKETNSMSITFHATGARNTLGFVAEVVTLPISFVGIDRYVMHNISFSVFDNNQRGAVRYTSAGEMNPILTMARNQFTRNCEDLYGNYSSCQSAIFVDIQNTQDFFFHNNYVSENMGGLFIRAGSAGTATALRGILHNNVFSENKKKVTLHLEGIQTSPYQQIMLYRNYMTRNNVSHEPVIKMNQVVCNATRNTFFNNRGKVIMEVTGFDNVRLPIYQSFTHNGWHNNLAYGLHCDKTTLLTRRCAWGSRATVLAGSAGMEFVDNIFYNRQNDYELVTLNRSQFDVWKTPINAKYNYWGYNETYAVAGRIKDLHDDDGLLEVAFTPFHMNNKTLMSGKCHPGWTLIGNTCFMYHGAPMSFNEAKAFCAKDNASMPYMMERYYQIHRYLESQQRDWRYYDMVWVQHLDSPAAECTAFVDGGVDAVSCDFLLPTLCELDPHVNPGFSIHHLEDYVTIASLCAAVGCFLLIVLICVLWCSKSRARKKERFERRNSIRLSKSSLGSRSLASMQSAGFSDINYRRRMISQSNSRQPSIVGTNPYGDYKVPNAYDTYHKSLNNTIDTTMTSYEMAYGDQQVNTGTLGSHISPNTVQQFNDLHEVHYVPGGANANTNATVHLPKDYEGFENKAYRPETRQSLLRPEDSQASLWQNGGASQAPAEGLNMAVAPPSYNVATNLDKTKATGDSVLDFKRDLADQLGRRGQEDSANTSSTTEGTEQEYQAMDQEYSTFRPQSQYGTNTRSMHSNVETIPSVPGYAQPFGHVQSQRPGRPYDRPPEPPAQRPRSAVGRSYQDLPPAPIETNFDDPEPESLPPAPKPPTTSRIVRTKSVGEILETNLDDDDGSPLVRQASGHSRSMQAMNDTLLETDM